MIFAYKMFFYFLLKTKLEMDVFSLKSLLQEKERKICIDYVKFYNLNGKAPSLFSKNENEQRLARNHINLIFENNRKNLFFYL